MGPFFKLSIDEGVHLSLLIVEDDVTWTGEEHITGGFINEVSVILLCFSFLSLPVKCLQVYLGRGNWVIFKLTAEDPPQELSE